MKEYTILSLLSVIAVLLLDRLLRTRVITRGVFWVFLAVMYAFKIPSNGYLTGRPIVLYGEKFFMNVRLLTIPLEDFVYGFGLMALTIILWEHFKRKEEAR